MKIPHLRHVLMTSLSIEGKSERIRKFVTSASSEVCEVPERVRAFCDYLTSWSFLT